MQSNNAVSAANIRALRAIIALSLASGIGATPLISAAQAGETITYTYDAKGRLVRVVRTGSVNNGVAANYEYDRANNRRRILVTSSPNLPPP